MPPAHVYIGVRLQRIPHYREHRETHGVTPPAHGTPHSGGKGWRTSEDCRGGRGTARAPRPKTIVWKSEWDFLRGCTDRTKENTDTKQTLRPGRWWVWGRAGVSSWQVWVVVDGVAPHKQSAVLRCSSVQRLGARSAAPAAAARALLLHAPAGLCRTLRPGNRMQKPRRPLRSRRLLFTTGPGPSTRRLDRVTGWGRASGRGSLATPAAPLAQWLARRALPLLLHAPLRHLTTSENKWTMGVQWSALPPLLSPPARPTHHSPSVCTEATKAAAGRPPARYCHSVSTYGLRAAHSCAWANATHRPRRPRRPGRARRRGSQRCTTCPGARSRRRSRGARSRCRLAERG